jgi:hypothetical protein
MTIKPYQLPNLPLELNQQEVRDLIASICDHRCNLQDNADQSALEGFHVSEAIARCQIERLYYLQLKLDEFIQKLAKLQ